MANASNTETIQGAHLLPESLPFASEPWTSFYRAGEIIRELHKARGVEIRVEPGAPHRPEDSRYDEAAASRMNDEGCPNERDPGLLDATGCFGIGGRLLLAGSRVS